MNLMSELTRIMPPQQAQSFGHVPQPMGNAAAVSVENMQHDASAGTEPTNQHRSALVTILVESTPELSLTCHGGRGGQGSDDPPGPGGSPGRLQQERGKHNQASTLQASSQLKHCRL
jgi:hypothetical protein